MAVENPPFALQAAGAKHSAVLFRRAVASLLGSGGIVGGLLVNEHVAANMSVNVIEGSAWVTGTSASNQSAYFVANIGTVNLALNAASATNPRIDKVVLRIKDETYAGVGNEALLEVVAGTAEAGATLANKKGAGATPVSSLVLAYILVPALATSIVAANIENVVSQMGLAIASGQKWVWKTYTKAEMEAGVEPSATRTAQIAPTIAIASIGGVAVPPAATAAAPFLIPPGQKWKVAAPPATAEVGTLLL